MKCSSKLTHQNAIGFLQVVYIGMISISFFSQSLSFVIFVVTHSIAQHTQKYSAFTFSFYQLLQAFHRRNTHIEIAVGTKDNTIVSFRKEVLLSHLISQLDTCTTSGRATGCKLVYRISYFLFVTARSRFQFHTGIACIHYNRYPILITQVVHQ